MLHPKVASARGQIAALTRSRPDDDPDLNEARRALAAAKVQSCLEAALAAGVLSREDRNHLISLLASSGAL